MADVAQAHPKQPVSILIEQPFLGEGVAPLALFDKLLEHGGGWWNGIVSMTEMPTPAKGLPEPQKKTTAAWRWRGSWFV
ncbi:hypothetical protein GCM10027423_23810 [Spirosoma arcticum]